MKPTELAITLATAAAAGWSRDGWVAADDVRGKLVLLGFDCSAQQVAAWLRRMAGADAPWVESRRTHVRYGRGCEYRVTQHGANDVDNRLPGVTLRLPWLPTVRAALDEVPAYNCLRHGLRAIRTAGDGAPFADAYRDAGGGYEGLQAIATAALAMADQLAADDGASRA